MRKRVYLFELDSVRKTDNEIEKAFQTLYDEIVINGNIIVMTFNQFVESRLFFEFMITKEFYESITKMFEDGYLVISQYGDKRSLQQYLIESLIPGRKFVYSGWPLKSEQKRLLALIRRCMIYSDLSELIGYIDLADKAMKEEDSGNIVTEAKKEIRELFSDGYTDESGKENSELGFGQMKTILVNLMWLLKSILRISSFVMSDDESESNYKTIYQMAKPDAKDSPKLNLYRLICYVMNDGFERENAGKDDKVLWTAVRALLKNTQSYFDKKNKRSDYHLDLLNMYNTAIWDGSGKYCSEKKVYQYAEAVIDIIYNYVVEYSINNVSKHYNDSKLLEAIEVTENDKTIKICESFRKDFFSRLDELWYVDEPDRRFLQKETNDFPVGGGLDSKRKNKKCLKKLIKAVRIAEYAKTGLVKRNSNAGGNNTVESYEYKVRKQRSDRKESILRSIFLRIINVIGVLLVAIGVEYAMNYFQDMFDEYVKLSSSVEVLLFLMLSEVITEIISKLFKLRGHEFLSLSDALGVIIQTVCDFVRTLFGRSYSHINMSAECAEESSEVFRDGVMINYAESTELKNYYLDRNNSKLFADSDIYPIANESYAVELAKQEEITGHPFGKIYESPYNTLLVDPIMKKNPGKGELRFFPYERVVPKNGNGVVMMVTCHGKFILLKQFRHALRRTQIGFPRGYGEKGISPKDNAKKEIREELGEDAVVNGDPIKLGVVTPDSGLSASSAEVFLVDVEKYDKSSREEGIVEILELTEQELEDRICRVKDDENRIDDGFTLAAYTLYKAYKKSTDTHPSCCHNSCRRS